MTRIGADLPGRHWAFAMPRGIDNTADLAWLSRLSTTLAASGQRVSWGVPAQAAPMQAPDPVFVYPYAVLSPEIDRVGVHGHYLFHNVDAPCPQADRLQHLIGGLRLGGDDVCVLPDAQLSDLEALFPLYAYNDVARLPVTVLRLARLATTRDAARLPMRDLEERLRWAAWRLAALGLLQRRILVWPGNSVIAAMLKAAALECMPPLRVLAAPAALPRVLVAVSGFGDDVAATVERLRLVGRAPVDVVYGAAPNAQPPGAWMAGTTAADFTGGTYSAAVCERDMLAVLARTETWVPDGAAVIVGEPGNLDIASVPRLREAEARTLKALQQNTAPEQEEKLAAALETAVQHASRAPYTPAPVVVHIAPAWAGAGSSHVFATQLDWLAERGLPTICLHLDTDDMEANTTPEALPGAIARRLAALPGDRALCRWFVSRPSIHARTERAAQLTLPYAPLSLEGEERIARHVALPDTLVRLLRHHPVRFVVLNYGHNWPILQRLGLEDAPVMLETHDVRPIQHALYNERPLIASAVQVELGMFARATGTVFINEEERTQFKAAYPKARAVSAFPYRDGPVPAVQAAFGTCATSLFSATRIPMSVLRELIAPREARRRRIALFVGSGHKANVMSLEWLFARAYPQGLYDPRLLVLVAGNIADSFRDVDLPNVVFTGAVPDLAPLYEAADLVLLPVRAGTGLPIKTLDALAHRVPFVATRQATQAIPGLTDLVGDFSESRDFARRVLDIAFDPVVVETLRQELDAWRAGSARWSIYTGVWDRLTREAGVSLSNASPPPPPPRHGAFPLVQPAVLRQGRWGFTKGHGLDGLVGLQDLGNGGWSISNGYSRFVLSFSTLSLQGREVDVSFRLTLAVAGTVALALDGEVQAWLTLEPDQPRDLHLGVPVGPQTTARLAVIEFRVSAAVGEADEVGTIEHLRARETPGIFGLAELG